MASAHTGNDVDMVYSHMALKFAPLKLLGPIVAPQGRNNFQQETTMKIFQRYNPLQVAEVREDPCSVDGYISRMLALLSSIRVRFLSLKVRDKQHLSVMSEVNRQVMRLQTEMA